MTIQDKFTTELMSIPAPGGAGCHTALMRVANLGVMAGIPPAQLHQQMRQAIPEGGRFVPDKEINDTIRKATLDVRLDDCGQYRFQVALKARPLIMPQMAQALIDKAEGITDVDLWESSPVRLLDDPVDD